MTRNLKRLYRANIFTYHHKFKRAFFKIKTFYHILDIYEAMKIRRQYKLKKKNKRNIHVNQADNKSDRLEVLEIVKLCKIELNNFTKSGLYPKTN